MKVSREQWRSNGDERKKPRRFQVTSIREEEAEDEIKEYLSRQGHRERHNDGLAERDEDD
jgi:hypothetical protein